MAKTDALPASLAPIGLCREAAAAFIGVGVTKFDQMVGDGRMPRPKKIDGRFVWSRQSVELAFSALPEDGEPAPSRNPWDEEVAA